MKNYKICFLASPGGHLAQLYSVKDIAKRKNRFFVTMPTKDSYTTLHSESVIFFKLRLSDTNFLLNQLNRFLSLYLIFFQSLKIIKERKFDFLITTGANVGIILCFVSWLCGKKIIFIESYASVTRFGKLLNLISHRTFVQWDSHQTFHSKSKLISPLYTNSTYENYEYNFGKEYFYVSVGSTEYQFNRLLKCMEKIRKSFNIPVIGQIGNSDYIPDFLHRRTFSKKAHMTLINNCKFFITHGGSSNLWDSQEMGVNTIIFPRLAKYGEHIDDHQLFLTKMFGDKSPAKVAHSYKDIVSSLKEDFLEKSDKDIYENPISQIRKELGLEQ